MLIELKKLDLLMYLESIAQFQLQKLFVIMISVQNISNLIAKFSFSQILWIHY